MSSPLTGSDYEKLLENLPSKLYFLIILSKFGIHFLSLYRFMTFQEYGKIPMALSCRLSSFYGPYTMDRNNYIEIHPTQAQVAKISYHHPSKYLNQNVSPITESEGRCGKE
jgi:hypothetical protein